MLALESGQVCHATATLGGEVANSPEVDKWWIGERSGWLINWYAGAKSS